MNILAWIVSLFTSHSKGAAAIGNAVVNVSTIAALAPLGLWLVGNKDAIAVTFTYGQLAIACGFVGGVIKLAHVLRRGDPADRKEFG